MRTLLLVAALASTALADTPVIKDKFAFDMMAPKTSKCAKVTGALYSKLTKSYTCKKPDAGGTASGKPALSLCATKNEDSQYLVFDKEVDCKAERDTQLANGG